MSVHMLESVVSARSELRAWINEQIADRSDLCLPEFKAEAVLYARSAGIADRLVEEMIEGEVYDVSRRLIAETRRVRLGDSLVSKDALRGRVAQFRSRFERWMEHAGDRHYLLLDMTRDQLLLAVKERSDRAASEQRLATFMRALADKTKRGKTVRQSMSIEEVERIAKECGLT